MSLDALPEFTPGKTQLGVLGDLHHALRCCMTEGACVPVTLLTMHTKVRKEAAAVLYKFLGDILPKFQLDLSDSSTVLPRQVMLLMFKAFDMSRDRYNKDEEARIKSQKVYAAMKAAQRKRPAEQTLKRVCDRQKDPDAKLAIAKKRSMAGRDHSHGARYTCYYVRLHLWRLGFTPRSNLMMKLSPRQVGFGAPC